MRKTAVAWCGALLASAVAPCAVPALAAQPAPAAQPAQAARGVVVGEVIDRESGRPVAGVNIEAVGTQLRARTDLDGKFRLVVPVGVYAIKASRLGSTAQQQDGVRVSAGASTVVRFALATAVVRLQAVAVTAGPVRAASEDALLAQQRNSTRVSDGISAEAISRAPGADAGEAIVRVSGVSLVDNKFAVVRGLAERYSNTLLNGVELPSPEPLKKIVPLDLFPSSLLESIVVSKTATPDRPGDFAGGSVEVTTKEFPNERVSEASITTGYNSQATGRRIAHLPWRGIDYLGFDAGGRRAIPEGRPVGGGAVSERFAEGFRNEWTPVPRAIIPDLAGSMNFGGRFGGSTAPIGYAIAGSYNRQTDATPNRFQQLLFSRNPDLPEAGFTSSEATASVDLGLIANLSAQLGSSSKVGWKNIATRNAEERLSEAVGFEPGSGGGNIERRIHQVRYITRSLVQTQLRGDHLVSPLWNSRIEWRATLAASQRDEPENRSLVYTRGTGQTAFELGANSLSPIWYRTLDDRVRSLQLDWSVPIMRLLRDGSQFKYGGMVRTRDRAFQAAFLRALPDASPAAQPLRTLAPEQVFSPEIIGNGLVIDRVSTRSAAPYESDDDVTAMYAMLDVPVTSRLRVIGGVRRERWALNVFNETRAAVRADSTQAPLQRRTTDNLLSINTTFKLTELQNLRIAAYQTVARPDAREIAPDYYVAITGDCGFIGDTSTRASNIMNADIRWERYPAPGEIFSISAFQKRFRQPIVETVQYEGNSLCTVRPTNFASARVAGAELEVRRSLSFLPGILGRTAAALNVTAVRSQTTDVVSDTVTRRFQLQGQSDLLANLNLLYSSVDKRTDASLLLNYFSDRVTRYGIAQTGSEGFVQFPNLIEQGRLTLDAKVRRKLGRATLSVSARNLTDAEVIFVQDSDRGKVRVGYLRPGFGFSVGLGYALR